ncbi:carbohydrate ABC transporter permease [Gorillibacterium sp. sgz5001074]|uniref:carbohydrate ABC transporter permease n=1 Tax=Gorillibacterium sp. sgz5001074 TaxID=3446695 RepID=UPI003F662461
MRKSYDEIIFNLIAKGFIGIMALFCAVPFVMLISGSFSSEESIMKHGYSLFPRGFSTDAYKFIADSPQKVLNAYGITILVTFVSCALALWLISMTAYVLFREDFKWRNGFAFFFYLTTIFNGGLLPAYILMVRYLHLKNSLLALILPGIFSVFFLLIMRNFMKGTIPVELMESSKIDGAGDFYIYWRIVLPLMKPALATIGLFEVIGYWNNWYNAMLYINKESLFPLQYLLYRILTASQGISEAAMNSVNVQTVPKETFKLAMTVVAIGPIILAYPFVQRFFVQGITIGAVKG